MEEKVLARGIFSRNLFCMILVLATVLCGLVACGNGANIGLTEETPTLKTELTAEEIYKKASPSVVEVTAESSSSVSTGTGFFIDDNGTVVTNYHVIDNCKTAKITLADGRTFVINKVLGYSESKDLAILSTDCQNSIPLKLRKSGVETGEKVYAIGSSLGLSGSLSEGIISTAEREIDGQILIQTTAPISHGNSGGPLLDSTGMVVGITTATLAEGQNLNFAIPVSEIDSISRNSPTTLLEMFSQSVEWISERDFFYYDDDEAFVLVFQLSDEDEMPMSSSGKAEIRIVNDNGVTVYNKTHNFTENDFCEWTYDDSGELYLATIYIDPNNIMLGSCSEGTIYFTVYGDDYYFEESTLYVSDLPVNAIGVLSNHIYRHGTYNSQYTWYSVDKEYYYSEYDVYMSITYQTEDKDLFVTMNFYTTDNIWLNVYLSLDNSESDLFYSCSYFEKDGAYSDYELLNETWGYIDPETFTDKTTLTYMEYDGLPNQKTDILQIYTSNIQDLLDWLDTYLQTENVGITLSDLGFKAYK